MSKDGNNVASDLEIKGSLVPMQNEMCPQCSFSMTVGVMDKCVMCPTLTLPTEVHPLSPRDGQQQK